MFLVAHPRGRRDRLRAPGLRRRRRARHRPTRSSTSGWSRSSSRSPTWRVPEKAPRQDEPQGCTGDTSLGPTVTAPRDLRSTSCPTARRSTGANLGGPPTSRAQAVLLPHQQAGHRGGQHRRGPARPGRRTRRAGRAELDGAEVVPLCVQLEAEAALLDADERQEMLEASRVSARVPVPRFLTPPTTCSGCGRSSRPARRRAGRGPSGPARRRPECAGVIHTDFQRGFIRAETIQWDELLAVGSLGRRPRRRQGPHRGQGLHRPGRRRHGVPLQRLRQAMSEPGVAGAPSVGGAGK